MEIVAISGCLLAGVEIEGHEDRLGSIAGPHERWLTDLQFQKIDSPGSWHWWLSGTTAALPAYTFPYS